MMRRLFLYLILLVLCSACTMREERDYGYPSKCKFGKDGGSQTITGYFGAFSFETLEDDSEIIFSDTTGVSCVGNSWVSVSHKYWECRMTITVKPAPNNKRRTFTFSIGDDFGYQDITIVQN